MKVFLTDDHSILLDGLVNLLAGFEEIDVIGVANNGQQTLDLLTRETPDVLITDYNLPDFNGLELIKKVKSKYQGIKFLVLSMHDELHLVKSLLKEGIHGFVLKKDSHVELTNALFAIQKGKIFLSSDINSVLVKELTSPSKKSLLTERELQILKLITEEFTNKEIGDKLFISERTVETHRKNIFRKTETSNLVGLMKFAYENQLI